MGSTTDKIKGTANEAMGKAKQGVGEATGSERLKGEGAVQEVKGKGQQAMGDAKDAAKDDVDRAAAAANAAREHHASHESEKTGREAGLFVCGLTSPRAIPRRTSASRSAGSRR